MYNKSIQFSVLISLEHSSFMVRGNSGETFIIFNLPQKKIKKNRPMVQWYTKSHNGCIMCSQFIPQGQWLVQAWPLLVCFCTNVFTIICTVCTTQILWNGFLTINPTLDVLLISVPALYYGGQMLKLFGYLGINIKKTDFPTSVPEALEYIEECYRQ